MTHTNTFHGFSVEVAEEYGIQEAIVIHHLQHWIKLNKRKKQNFHEGRWWTYQTQEDIAAAFPYFTFEEVRGILERLSTGKGRRSEKKSKDFNPVILKGNFNKLKFDKTTWYAFVDEEKFIGNSNNAYERETSQFDKGDLPTPDGLPPTPIPDSKPDSKPKTVCPNPSGSASKVKKTTSDRKTIEATKDDLFFQAMKLRKDWTTEEIENAWIILADYDGAVNDWFRFIEGTIENNRKKKNLEKLKETTEHKTGDQWLMKNEKNSNLTSPLDHDSLMQVFQTLGCALPT